MVPRTHVRVLELVKEPALQLAAGVVPEERELGEVLDVDVLRDARIRGVDTGQGKGLGVDQRGGEHGLDAGQPPRQVQLELQVRRLRLLRDHKWVRERVYERKAVSDKAMTRPTA